MSGVLLNHSQSYPLRQGLSTTPWIWLVWLPCSGAPIFTESFHCRWASIHPQNFPGPGELNSGPHAWMGSALNAGPPSQPLWLFLWAVLETSVPAVRYNAHHVAKQLLLASLFRYWLLWFECEVSTTDQCTEHLDSRGQDCLERPWNL